MTHVDGLTMQKICSPAKKERQAQTSTEAAVTLTLNQFLPVTHCTPLKYLIYIRQQCFELPGFPAVS